MATSSGDLQLARQAYLWFMACMYMFAFASLYTQVPGGLHHKQRRGEGLETHCVYVCTLTVIGVFLFDNFLPLFWGGKQLE